MTTIKFGKKNLKIKFTYKATFKTGILRKFAKFATTQEKGETMDILDQTMGIVPEMILAGVQKYHSDEYGYDYDTGEGREEALSKIYDLLDDYFDDDAADFNALMDALQKELLEDGFLAKMLRKELKAAEKESKKTA